MDVICGYPESPTTSTTHKPFLPPRITPPVPARSNNHLKQQQQQQQPQQQQQQLLETESITPLDGKDTFRPSFLFHNQPEKLVKKSRNANEYLADKENIIVHKSSKQRDLGSLLSTKVPPIPPRVPLTRSISLTYRPPPPPISDATSASESLSTNFRKKDGPIANSCRLIDNPFNGLDNIPTIVDPLKPRRRGGVPQVRSAPTLNNVHNITNVNNAHVKHLVALSPANQLTIRQHHDKGVADNQTIIPLARWPLTEAQPRTNHPFLDSLASRLHGSTNEYVDSPRTISRTKSLISTLNLTSNGNNFTTSSRALNELSSWGSHGTSLNRACNASILASTTHFKEKKQRNMLKKLKLFVNNNRMKRGSVHADAERPSLNSHLTYQSTVTNTTALVEPTTTPTTRECTNSIICRQCGRCRCKDCMNSSRRTGRIASSIQDESLLDCLSCMCAIKPIFYHCLKDSNGEDDCSEEPCACCSQPNCFPRWAILGMFLPCLPCLCFYLPLRCLLDVCLGCFSNDIGCQCEHKSHKSSGFKTLLESENSSA